MVRPLLSCAALAVLAGCPREPGPPTPPELEGVMRDCPEDVGNICPWAGAGYNGFNGDDVEVLDAWFSFPMGVAFHPDRPPVIADWNNHRLREVNVGASSGPGFRTIMGTDFLGDGDANLLDSTEAGAPGTDVALNHPTQHVWFADGTLLSASWHTHKLRTWNPDTGIVHVWLGGAPGWSGTDFAEPAASTRMNQPKEVLLSADEQFAYILDMRNERIRRLDIATWTVDTIAGNGDKCVAATGADLGDGGPAVDACFSFPKNANPEPGGAMALTSDGATLYVADSENHVIRVIDLVGGTIDLLSGTPGVAGASDGALADATWNYPVDLALDEATGELFVADANNHKVRVIDLGTGQVATAAGTGASSCPTPDGLLVPVVCDEQHRGGDGGPAVDATLYRPFAVDFDLDGNLIVADTYNHRYRKVIR